MSPASKSKGKDKSSGKTNKEQSKASKPSASASTGSGITGRTYNPFHTLETPPIASSPPPHSNGRFRNIDETDDHSGSSLGTGAEYDSVSNNDSCSGESEDLKEKVATTTARQEAIPGSDNDKREKIRQKNERKHQRQRERRAQELHERCSGYLMSRKLEALAQQLVAMGFSSERATMALILNEGRIEESVAWLFEGSEETTQQKDSNIDNGSNLKIDITEELNQITELEIKYKCSKQEVERAVVTCEGDLEKAADIVRIQKQEQPTSSPPKPGEIGDPPSVNGSKLAVSSVQNPVRPQAKTNGPVVIQQRRDDRDFNYTKPVPTVMTAPESANRNFQPLRRIQPKSEWVRPQVPAPVEKRWPNGASSPSVSYSLASPLQAAPPPSKAEARYVVVGSEAKNLPMGSVREPVIMMQRPQSINSKQNHPATSINASSPPTTGWYPNSLAGVEISKSDGGLQHVPSTTSIAPNNLSSQQYFHNPNHQPFTSSPVDTPGSGWGSSYGTTGTSSLSSLAVPSSLGLFSGWGSTGASGSSSPVDWNTGGSMPQCDYTSIDWTLESTAPATSNGLWLGLADFVKNSRMYDSWSSTTSAGANPSTRSTGSNGVCIASLQEGVAAETSSAPTSEVPHEWTSPFAGKDLFSLPRQFVTSPSL
ncbi:Ubiquitin-associated/translation elongation factor EF1B protein [Thalictrum thalictroides]|uniref:Ubiquitin-associated/translation elongation factor EF1B protein n=1 Tax=Thalictrum thalictroides TaxID=46969 RepID=A0A7J6W4M1_THATH|nr:Ubiquitin-associated/translation elongation factor EF1B protein [Thalictrum thalictroides]